MTKLTDFMKLKPKAFWKMVDTDGDKAAVTFKRLWDELDERPLTQDEAVECLDALFIDSHRRIREFSSALAKNYPTKQFTRNKLAKVAHIWWVDHFTAGISKWSTLNWFSAKKGYFRGSKKLRYAGACTHFVQGYHGDPFYIIPLMHGSWNEPRRNKDSFSIEHVNAGALHRDKDDKWCYWARPMPQALVEELPPVLLDKPYRGVKVMQPYTLDQIKNNVKLKRLINAAEPGRMDPCRMSQHTDWRKHKTDMGVLWPYEECNSAAFDTDPIPELDFIQRDDYIELLDEEGTVWDEVRGWDDETEAQNNPSYGLETPTHDKDPDDDDDEVFDTRELQQALVKKGYSIIIDGIPGPKTRQATRLFQSDWNKKNPKDKLKVDGIPGPRTCTRLQK